MADYYKLVGSENSTTDWTSSVILERDDDGNVTKEVGVDRPAQLTKEDLDTVKGLGLKVEKSSKDEADQAEAAAVSNDALASAPLIGSGTNPGESSKSTTDQSK